MAVAAVADPPSNAQDILKSWPYRFELIAPDDLFVDEAYQRPLTSFWQEVRDEFNPALVGTLIVSERKNGTKAIIDGQTRWEAMKEQTLPACPCLVYSGLSKTQEAELFADLQTKRRGMRTYHRFRAQLVAKRPEQVKIAKAVTAAGFELGIHETPNTLQSIAALERAFRIDGNGEHLTDVLEVIRQAWGTESKDAVSAQIIAGLSTFIRGQERLDYERLVKRLKDVTPKLIQNRAAQIREGAGSGTGSARSVAQAIMSEYTRKR